VTARISSTADQFAALKQHLREPECVAFMYTDFRDECFHVIALEAMLESDIASRSDRHVLLHDDVRPRLIARASARGWGLVEAHSHGPRGHAAFSPSDLAAFENWVPHLWWRLRGRPYAALVVAGDRWDALAWIDGPRDPRPVAQIDIAGPAGDTRVIPTGTTFWRLQERDLRMRKSA
jgi:hypothetical protein